METMNKLKKGKKRSVWMKPLLKDRLRTGAYQNIFQATLERQRRNTNLNKNIVMAAPVTMNSTLDDAGVLDPLLKFIFKK